MVKKIAFKGNPLTLVGRSLNQGDIAPGFRAVSVDLEDVGLEDFKDRIKIIGSFPSLDTPVCDLQVKEFNKRAASLSSDVTVIGISKDLPFAQKRFCSENQINKEVVLSDYRYSSFGINYGLLIKELNLLARAVIILDKKDVVRYIQVAGELTSHLNYDEAIGKAAEVLDNPAMGVAVDLPVRCLPCEGKVPALQKKEIERLIAERNDWQLVEDKKITKDFKFKDFEEAKYFLDLVSLIAKEQGHHPMLTLTYNKLKVTLTTHIAGGLTENDFIMARIIDGL